MVEAAPGLDPTDLDSSLGPATDHHKATVQVHSLGATIQNLLPFLFPTGLPLPQSIWRA